MLYHHPLKKDGRDMTMEQLNRMREGKGFIAALDQSGGSTPKALKEYGINPDKYSGDEEMFALVHQMRSRIMMSPAFTSRHILGAILFEGTVDREVAGEPTADYLWQRKGILPILKVDKGLADAADGVQLMKPIPNLGELLKKAVSKHIFGTKMRSVIKEANEAGIAEIVAQQFEVGREILEAGLVPILEPEVDIKSADRAESERILKRETFKHLAKLKSGMQVMFKFSIPVEEGFYSDLMKDEHVLRIVALSGGFSRADANERLARNPGLIASFSRALLEGLNAGQSDEEFNATLAESIKGIYEASIT